MQGGLGSLKVELCHWDPDAIIVMNKVENPRNMEIKFSVGIKGFKVLRVIVLQAHSWVLILVYKWTGKVDLSERNKVD